MSYHTALAVAVTRPVHVRIGRVTLVCRPVSAVAVLEALALEADGRRADAEYRILRAAFPRRAWWRRDPLRVVAQLPAELRAEIVRKLIAKPRDPKSAEPESDTAWIRRSQQSALRPAATARPEPKITLAIVVMTCRAWLGEAWYYNARYPTVDGFVPHSQAWLDYEGVGLVESRQIYATLRAHKTLSLTKQHELTHRVDAILRAAYPPDPMSATTPLPH